MKQKLLSKLEATVPPEVIDFRLTISRWLNKYPWSHLWTPTFRKAELRGAASYTRTSGHSTVLPSPAAEFLGASPTFARSGGGRFKENPFWKGGESDSGLHTSGYSEEAAVRATKRFLKRHMKEFSWFFVSEQNPGREGHHVHCLLIPPKGERINVPRLSAMWWKTYGWNKFEPIRGTKEVTSYCTKHVTAYCLKNDNFLKSKKQSNGWYEIEINDTQLYHQATKS